MRKLKLACIQYGSSPDWRRDLDTAFTLSEKAIRNGARLIALPEFCAGLGSSKGEFSPFSAPEEEHPILQALQSFAAGQRVELLVGSLAVSSADGRILNRSFLVGDDGRIRQRYDKIHLFDIDLGAEGGCFQESAVVAPGEEAATVLTHAGVMGMSICYDLRFPKLYRAYAQAGASVLAIPAAFVARTGAAHWHTLIRARAIENGAFVIAPGQCGNAAGVDFYGHSLIVDPWGQVLEDAGSEPGAIVAEIDLDQVASVRTRIPAWNAERSFVIRQ